MAPYGCGTPEQGSRRRSCRDTGAGAGRWHSGPTGPPGPRGAWSARGGRGRVGRGSGGARAASPSSPRGLGEGGGVFARRHHGGLGRKRRHREAVGCANGGTERLTSGAIGSSRLGLAPIVLGDWLPSGACSRAGDRKGVSSGTFGS